MTDPVLNTNTTDNGLYFPEQNSSGAPLTPLQQASFAVKRKTGEIDDAAPAGELANPYALSQDEDLNNLAEGQFAVGRDGVLMRREQVAIANAEERITATHTESEHLFNRLMSSGAAVYKDVSDLSQVGMGIMSGVVKGVGNTMNATGDLADAFSNATADIPVIDVLNAGVVMDDEGIRFLNSDEMRRWRAVNVPRLREQYDTPLGQVPFIGGFLDRLSSYDPNTVTGDITKGIGQVVGPAGLAAKAMGGIRGATAVGTGVRAAIAGAAGDFFGVAPEDPRVANILVEQFPQLESSIIGWLAADEEDSALEGRLKNVLEGATIGIGVEGLMAGLRAGRKALHTSMKADPKIAEAVANQARVTEEMATARAEFDARFKELMGDDADELVIVAPRIDTPTPANVAGARMQEATPEQVAAGMDARTEPNRLGGRSLIEGQVSPEGYAENLPFRFNMSRINTPNDVKAALLETVTRVLPDVQDARRGVVTWAETRKASRKVDLVQVIKDWEPGTAVNAEVGKALRDLEATLARQFTEVTRKVTAKGYTPSAADLLAWKRSAGVVAMTNAVTRGVTAETARALNAMKMPAGSNANVLAQAEKLLTEEGGLQAIFKAAQDISRRLDDGEVIAPKELGQIAEATLGSRLMTASQVMKLANVKTQARNIMGNSIGLLMEVSHRDMAGQIAKTVGETGGGSVQVGEGAEMMAAIAPAFMDLWRSGFSLSRMADQADEAASAALDPSAKVASTSRFARARIAMGPGRMGMDAVGGDAIIFSTRDAHERVNTPQIDMDERITARGLARSLARGADSTAGGVFKFMESADQAFKYLGVNMELRAQAFRRAREEVFAGAVPSSQAAARMDHWFNNPTDEMIESAAKFAEEVTFTRPHLPRKMMNGDKTGEAGFGNALMNFRQNMVEGPVPINEGLGPMTSGLARAANTTSAVLSSQLMPFLATPVNIASYAGRSTPLAPIFGRFQQDMVAGGARAQIAEARAMQGSVLMFLSMSLAAEGFITGDAPNQPGMMAQERRMGMPPMSLRLPQTDPKTGEQSITNISLRGLSPISDLLRLGAMMGDMMRRTNLTDNASRDTWGEGLSAAALAIAPLFMDQSSMTGFTQLMEAIESRDAVAAERLVTQMGASLVVPTIVQQAESFMNPDVESVHDWISAILARVPGETEKFDDDGGELDTARRDMWGRAINTSTGFGAVGDFMNSMVSPMSFERMVTVTPEQAMDDAANREMVNRRLGGERDERGTKAINLVDAELRRLNQVLRPKERSLEFKSDELGRNITVPLEDMPEVYNWMQAVAGPSAEYAALEVITSPEYKTLNPEERFEQIKEAYNDAYKPWRQVLQDLESPDNPFRARLKAAFEKRQADFRNNPNAGREDPMLTQ